MDSKNRIKQVDELGRIVIPKDIRKAFEITPEVDLEIYADGDTIFIKKAIPRCIFCSAEDELTKYKSHSVCKKCMSEIRTLY